MSHRVFLWTAFLLAFPNSYVLASETTEISLNGKWDFTYTRSSTASTPELPKDSDFESKIEVPGRWDDQLDDMKETKWWSRAIFQPSLGPVQYLSGTGWYRKSIDIPTSHNGKAATLTIGGGVGTVHVWLNGEHLGTYEYGVYTPYVLDVTKALLAGHNNEIVIAVDNASRNIFGGWTFLGNQGKASGLSRPVTLELAAGKGTIADLYVKPGTNLKEVNCQVELSVPGDNAEIPASQLEWTIREAASGKPIGSGQANVPAFTNKCMINWSESIPKIKPWSDRAPHLYYAEVRWIGPEGELWDNHTQRFGLRRWSYQGRQLFLNGKPHYLRLEFGCYYFPLNVAVPTSKEYWMKHMRKLKELGLNGINFAAQVCPIEMMEAADELGVILQCGDHVTTREGGKQYYKDVWEDIVRTTRRYPSVGIYGFGGELKYYEGVIEHNKVQMDLIKSLHPESLVMPQQAIHGIDYGLEDLSDPGVTLDPFPHHAERLDRYTDACDLFGHFSGGGFSHSYFSTRQTWREMQRRFQIYEKPLVAHELFISASYLNPENMKNYTGRVPPYIYTRLEKDLNSAGMLEKWPTYFDHTSRLQHSCRKYCLEKVRKSSDQAGYELLGMMDMHFITPEYAVGIVDEFLHMKPGDTAQGVRKYLDESVLLLDFDNGLGMNRCYWEEDNFSASVMVSLFGPKPLDSGRLEWVLSNGEKKLVSGSKELTEIANGSVSVLKDLDITWPTVEITTKLNLSVRLVGGDYDLNNDWDFWVFPKLRPLEVALDADAAVRGVIIDSSGEFNKTKSLRERPGAHLRVVSELTAKDVEHLKQGGDVILLGTKPFTEYKKWPYYYPAKGFRPFSNGGTILADHPVFAAHPHEGWNDWHFLPLMHGASCILFDGKINMEFDPIMELISSAGHVRKQAQIFEKQVGSGRLLVSTLLLDLDNPSCATLLDSILRYAAGDAFRPQGAISPESLTDVLKGKMDSKNLLKDPGFEWSGFWLTESGSVETSSDCFGGERSLKLSINKDQLNGNRYFSSRISARNLQPRKTPQYLKLSAWVKTSPDLGTPGKAEFEAYLRYQDSHIRGDTFALTIDEPSEVWQYYEAFYETNGQISNTNVNLNLGGSSGSVWFDDVYFGEATAEEFAASGQIVDDPPTEQWIRENVSRSFDKPHYVRINGGEWNQETSVTIDKEGSYNLKTKTSMEEAVVSQEEIHLDLTPPRVVLTLSPLPEQMGGLFTASKDTVFEFQVSDNLSGVKQIEFSTKSEASSSTAPKREASGFRVYKGPFALPPGKYEIRCRSTDYAGNQSQTMTGEWITGSEEDFMELEVVP